MARGRLAKLEGVDRLRRLRMCRSSGTGCAMIAAVTGVAGGAPRTEAGEGRLGWCAAEPLTRLACDRGHDGSAQASTEN